MAVNPKSLENLKKKKDFQSGNNAKENGRKGGIAKATNAQRIKEHTERMLAILDSEDFTGQTLQERMDRGLIRLVIENGPGSAAAYEKIMEYAGKSVLMELKREELKIKREELKLKKAELELKREQAEQKSGGDTERQEAAIRVRAALMAQVAAAMEENNGDQ